MVVLLFVAIVDFGRLVSTQAAVVTASREAARYGSVVGIVDGVERYRNCDRIRDAARAVTGGLITIDNASVDIKYDDGPDDTTADRPCVSTATAPAASAIPAFHRIVVTVTGRYEPISPIRLFAPGVDIQSVDRRTIVKSP